VMDVHHIERGYEDFVGRLAALGADVRVSDDGSCGTSGEAG
jgi:UDP-N-acetylglucosamine enolpyruvyl transferase